MLVLIEASYPLQQVSAQASNSTSLQKPEWHAQYFNWKHHSNAAKGIG